MLLYFVGLNCRELFVFQPRPGDSLGVFTIEANGGSQFVFLPLFSHVKYIFN